MFTKTTFDEQIYLQDDYPKHRIEQIINRSQSLHDHFRLPFTNGLYIQSVFNPWRENEYITVSSCVQRNFFQIEEKAPSSPMDSIAQSAVQMVQNAIPGLAQLTPSKKNQPVLVKRHLHHVDLESDGPSDEKGFAGENLTLPAQGLWAHKQIQYPITQDATQEYLIIAIWKFDVEEQQLDCQNEIVVMNPLKVKQNERPLYINLAQKVAYYFEKAEDCQIVYCEFSLISDLNEGFQNKVENSDSLIKRIKIQNCPSLYDALTQSQVSIAIERLALDDEIVLAFSQWTKPDAQPSQQSYQRGDKPERVLFQTRGGARLRGQRPQRGGSPFKRQRGRGQRGDGHQAPDLSTDPNDEATCELRFFSLKSQTFVWQTLFNFDSVLEWNPKTKQIWLLGQAVQQEFGGLTDLVAVYQFGELVNKANPTSTALQWWQGKEQNYLQGIRVNQLPTFCEAKLTGNQKRVALLSGYKQLVVLELERDNLIRISAQMSSRFQLQLVVNADKNKFSLIELSRQKLMQEDDGNQLNAKVTSYELGADEPLQEPLDPESSDLLVVDENSMISAQCQQQISVDDKKNMRMFIIDNDQSSFGLVSSGSVEIPLKPVPQQWLSRFPIVIMRTAKPSGYFLTVMNFMLPTQIWHLDLGDFRFVTFVEDQQLQSNDQIKVVCFLVEHRQKGDPDSSKQILLLTLEIDSFDQNVSSALKWNIIGECVSWINTSQIRTDGIVKAKLLKSNKDNELSLVVVQYTDSVVAVQVCFTKENVRLLQPHADSDQQNDLAFFEKQQQLRRGHFIDDLTNAERNSFGVKLVDESNGESLVHKNILLGKNGSTVYFVKQQGDMQAIVSAKIRKLPPDEEFNEETVFDMQTVQTYAASHIGFVELDNVQDLTFDSGLDAFFVLDSSQCLSHLQPHKQQIAGALNSHFVDWSVDLSHYQSMTQIIQRVVSKKWTHAAVDKHSFTWTNYTYSLEKNIKLKFPVLDEAASTRQVSAMRNTQQIIGIAKYSDQTSAFFTRSSPGQRAIDHLGSKSPHLTFTSFWRNEYIFYKWKNKASKIQYCYMFHNSGEFQSRIEPPDQYQDLEIFLSNHQCDGFLLRRLIPESKGNFEGCVCRIIKEGKQFFWQIVEKNAQLAFLGKCDESYYHQVSSKSSLISVKLQDDPTESVSTIMVQLQPERFCARKIITVTFGSKDTTSAEVMPKQVLLRRQACFVLMTDLKIKKLSFSQDTAEAQLAIVQLSIDLSNLVTNKKQMQQVRMDQTLNPMNFQISTPSSLILWDANVNKEFTALNSYKGVFDDPRNYTRTGFKIPVEIGRMTEMILQSNGGNFVHGRAKGFKPCVYKLNSQLACRHLQQISNLVDQQEILDSNSLSCLTICATFDRDSLFHLFARHSTVITAFYKAILTQEHALGTQEFDQMTFPCYKRIVQLLIMPNGHGLTPFNIAIINKADKAFSEMFRVTTFAKDTFITNRLLDDFNALTSIESETVNDFFHSKFVQNFACKAISKVQWETDQDTSIIPLKTSMITKQDIEEYTAPKWSKQPEDQIAVPESSDEDDPDGEIDDHKGRKFQFASQKLRIGNTNESQQKMVSVQMLDFDWLFKNENGKNLVLLLSETSNDALFGTTQIQTVIALLWQRYFSVIRNQVYFNFLRYFFCVVIYVTVLLGTVEDQLSPAMQLAKIILRIMIIFDAVLFTIIEVIQYRSEGFRSYCTDAWNWIDCSSVVLIVTLVTFDFTSAVNPHDLRRIGFTIVILKWIKFFYWMRLFDLTASFIRMIREILVDIAPFAVMLLICIGMFANGFAIIDRTRRLDGDVVITPDAYFQPQIDSLVMVFLLGMGEYSTDNFDAGDNITAWSLFLVACIVLQLTFMNMLIAIMGDTFDRVSQMKIQAGMQEKTQMIKDHLWLLNLPQEFNDKTYVFLVSQVKANGNSQHSAVWEGRVGQLKKAMNSHMDSIDKKLEKRLENLQSSITRIETQSLRQTNLAEKIEAQVYDLETLVKKRHSFRGI